MALGGELDQHVHCYEVTGGGENQTEIDVNDFGGTDLDILVETHFLDFVQKVGLCLVVWVEFFDVATWAICSVMTLVEFISTGETETFTFYFLPCAPGFVVYCVCVFLVWVVVCVKAFD